MIAHAVLVPGLPILLGFMVQVVRREGFSGQHIASMAVILQNLDNTGGGPLDVATLGGAL